MQRIAVVGTSCAGKTTFARRLAEITSAPHIELDALHWGPNWTAKPLEEFRSLVDRATRPARWVCDGNYLPVRDLVWGRADTLVWLNYSFPTVFSRGLRRTLARCATRERLYSDNRESFRIALLSRDSILLWILQTFWKQRREYPALFDLPEWSHVQVVEHRGPRESRRFLARLSQIGALEQN